MVNKTGKTIKKILIAAGIMTLFAVNLFAINHFAINKFSLTEPTSIGIISGADGPTAIYLSSTIDIVLLKFIWLPLLLIINVWVGWRFYKKRPPGSQVKI